MGRPVAFLRRLAALASGPACWRGLPRALVFDGFGRGVVVFGQNHLQYLVDEFVLGHYNVERPHQSMGNRPLSVEDDDDPPVLPFPAKIECAEKLGGLINQYRRAARQGMKPFEGKGKISEGKVRTWAREGRLIGHF